MGPPAGIRPPSAALVKWWKGYAPVHGLVTRTISPYRQDFITPWVKEWPGKLKHKVTDNFFDVVPPFLTLVGVVAWGDATFEAEVRKHRD
mmetsp:Transcript_16609/g.23486  ORF Transcript_16609/g.23486 Transcript_16609/m.23486 type:complete len:90 (+) Transcript_16609:119-388(+)